MKGNLNQIPPAWRSEGFGRTAHGRRTAGDRRRLRYEGDCIEEPISDAALARRLRTRTLAGAAKRGGQSPRVNLQEIPDIGSQRGSELIALDDALKALAKIDPRKARVIELRFFGGLSVEETVEVLKLSADTVLRDWRLARAWLLSELGSGSPREKK